MIYAFALLLVAHGIAHLPGFLVFLKLKTFPELPYKTTLFGGMIDVGYFGVRIVGIIWLLTGAAFVLAGIAVGMKTPSARYFTTVVTVLSLALTFSGWPEARIGLFVNVAVLIFLGLAWEN